jgi:hypothetical protein
MVQASLSRDGTSVDFQLNQDSGGTPTIIQSVSKPQQKLTPVSVVDPRVSDQFESVQSFILRGYIDGDSAYSDARVLAEELIKPHSGGNNLTLDLSNADGFSSYTVAPATESACELEYLPGQRDWIPLSLNLTRVDTTIGGAATEAPNTSAASPQGGGSVTLTNPGTGDSVDILHDLSITRTVGRPNTTIRPDPTQVAYIDKVRSAVDEWSIRGVLEGPTARSDSQTLIDILSAVRGRDGLTLEFNNNMYALSDKTVVPTGSEAGRRVIGASEPDMVRLDNITLRTVTV